VAVFRVNIHSLAAVGAPCSTLWAASHTRHISAKLSANAILNSLVETGPLFFDSRPNLMR
jgi:hypothetical protein